MKKLLTVLFLVTALLVPVIASAEEAPADAKKGPALENRKEVTADQMIERIEGRKAKMLEKIKERFDKLNEKLAGFEGRITKTPARQEKRARKGGEYKAEATATDKPVMSDEKIKERKEKVTERYNKFKKNIETRRDEMAKRQEENKAKFLARIEKFSQADKDRVIAAQEKMQSEVRAEVAKLADEALKKLEVTYQKIMGL